MILAGFQRYQLHHCLAFVRFVDDLQGFFNKGNQVILFQEYTLITWLEASVEGLGLHAARLDIVAMYAFALGPDATALSRESYEGAGGPTTTLHGSAHGSVPLRKAVGDMRW